MSADPLVQDALQELDRIRRIAEAMEAEIGLLRNERDVARAEVKQMRRALELVQLYFRVKKTWDNRLPELVWAKEAVTAALADQPKRST